MALDPNRMTVAEAASLTAAAVVGGGLWFALAGVSGQLPMWRRAWSLRL